MHSDIQIWPIGVGCVAVGFGVDEMAGSLMLAAIPDQSLREDWRTAAPTEDLWEQLDGQKCILHFKDAEAVDRMIETLETLKKDAFGQ